MNFWSCRWADRISAAAAGGMVAGFILSSDGARFICLRSALRKAVWRNGLKLTLGGMKMLSVTRTTLALRRVCPAHRLDLCTLMWAFPKVQVVHGYKHQ